jgi:hypothetical protein
LLREDSQTYSSLIEKPLSTKFADSVDFSNP